MNSVTSRPHHLSPRGSSQVRLSGLYVCRRRLVILCQRLGCGVVYGLPIRQRQPVLTTPLRMKRRQKIGAERHEYPIGDFVLRCDWIEFFNDLDQMPDGEIDELVIVHGLPHSYDHEPVIDA